MQYDHSSSDDRLWAMLSYLLALFFPIVAPLVIFLVKRQSRFVSFHALQALFVQVGLFVLGVAVAAISWFFAMLGPLGLLAIPVGIAAWVIGIAAVVYKIIAAIKSYGGEWYRIPVVAPYAERMV